MFCFIFVSVLFCFNSERSKTIDTVLQSREAEKKKKTNNANSNHLPLSSTNFQPSLSYSELPSNAAGKCKKRIAAPENRRRQTVKRNETKRTTARILPTAQRPSNTRHCKTPTPPLPTHPFTSQPAVRSDDQIGIQGQSLASLRAQNRHFTKASVITSLWLFIGRENRPVLSHPRSSSNIVSAPSLAQSPARQQAEKTLRPATLLCLLSSHFLYVSLPLEGIYVKKKKKKKKADQPCKEEVKKIK